MFDKITFDNLLSTRQMGRVLVALDEVDSTNKWISGNLHKPAVEKIVAVAKKQTAGRGRFGRVWRHVPGKSLAFSLAWPIPESFKPVGVITLLAGVALAEAVMEVADASPDLKYPNDLLFKGLKAGGILCELKKDGGQLFAVIGVGLNVNLTSDELPDEIKGMATSIRDQCGRDTSMEAILAIFLNRLEAYLEALVNNGPGVVVERYKKLTSTLGKNISVNGAGDDVTGVAVDVDYAGELIVDVGSGEFVKVHSGETVYKR